MIRTEWNLMKTDEGEDFLIGYWDGIPEAALATGSDESPAMEYAPPLFVPQWTVMIFRLKDEDKGNFKVAQVLVARRGKLVATVDKVHINAAVVIG